MKLEIPYERDFWIKERDGLTLIHPAPTKMSQSEWLDHERVFRSVLLDEEQNVVSIGFPKFFNYGEQPDDTDSLNKHLEQGKPVYFTEKVDGSLAIRSVINGEVNWRTRGTFDGMDFREGIERAAAKYPILSDPDYRPTQSMLFEFISPDHRIILSYSDYDLVLLGIVNHDDLSMLPVPELQRAAESDSLTIVSLLELPVQVEALVATVTLLEAQEGIVVRWEDKLLKLKSAQYLLKHRIKFALTNKAIREACVFHNVWSLKDFENYLKEIGGDWELASEAKPLVEKIIAARRAASTEFLLFKIRADGMVERYPVRKDFALEYATKLDPHWKTAAFMIADGKRARAWEVVEAYCLDQLLEAEKEVAEVEA